METIQDQALEVARTRMELEALETKLADLQAALYKTFQENNTEELATAFGTFKLAPTVKYIYTSETEALRKKYADEVIILCEREKAEGIAEKTSKINYKFLAIKL